MYDFIMEDTPNRVRVIDINRSGVQTILAQPDEDYDIQAAGAAETVQQGQDLWIYQDGELRAVVQDYYAYHSSAPAVAYNTADYYTPPPLTDNATPLPHSTATTTTTPSGGGSPGALPFVIGGIAVAGGVAALAAGGGGSKKDGNNGDAQPNHPASPAASGDDPARHNGSVSDSRFAGDRSTNNYYFIQALNNTDNSEGHLAGHVMGQPLTVRYHFATDAYDRIGGFYLSGFRAFSETQKADIRAAMANISRYTNVRFIEAGASEATLHYYLDDLTIAQEGHAEDTIVTGYARYGGDVHLNVRGFAADDAFRHGKQYIINGEGNFFPAGWATLFHEIGHSIGLTHPFGDQNSVSLSRSENRDDLTLMSYTAAHHAGQISFTLNGERYYINDVPLSPTQPGIYDLIALHYRYGVNPDYKSGNDTYHFSRFDPAVLGNGIYIFDGGGQDMLDASDQTQNLFLDLTPGSWNYAGSKTAQLALNDYGQPNSGQLFIGYGTQIESAKGGTGHDTIKGNSAANYLFGYDGNDNIDGGAGNDQIEGGRGADTLTGGRGADTFRFASPLDGTHDTITDFNLREGDLLELDHRIYTALQESGTLNAGQFVRGSAAQDEDDRIIYNPATGELAYDPDGSGAAAATLIANIGRDLELNANHIHII